MFELDHKESRSRHLLHLLKWMGPGRGGWGRGRGGGGRGTVYRAKPELTLSAKEKWPGKCTHRHGLTKKLSINIKHRSMHCSHRAGSEDAAEPAPYDFTRPLQLEPDAPSLSDRQLPPGNILSQGASSQLYVNVKDYCDMVEAPCCLQISA